MCVCGLYWLGPCSNILPLFPLFSSYCPPSLPPILRSCISRPSSALFIKFTTKREKAYTQYQRNIRLHLSSGWLSLSKLSLFHLSDGLCLCTSRAKREAQNIRIERWGATAPEPQTACRHHLFLFIGGTSFLLREISADVVLTEMLQLCKYVNFIRASKPERACSEHNSSCRKWKEVIPQEEGQKYI